MASFEDVLGSDNRLAKRLASTSWPDSRAKADRLLPLVTAANTDLVRDAVQAAPTDCRWYRYRGLTTT